MIQFFVTRMEKNCDRFLSVSQVTKFGRFLILKGKINSQEEQNKIFTCVELGNKCKRGPNILEKHILIQS
jgi:ABC-type enterochelin transport system ATPase subunit